MPASHAAVLPRAKPARRLGRGFLLRGMLLVLGGYGGICLMLGFLQRQLIYVPRTRPVSIADAGKLAERLHALQLDVTPDIQLQGWFCRAVDLTEFSLQSSSTAVPAASVELTLDSPTAAQQSAGERVSRRLVIVFPGNAGNRLNRVPILQMLSDLGCSVLIFDYRSYGGSHGTPSETALSHDARMIWDFACEELQFAPEEIVLMGQSLGGGVAVGLTHQLCQAEIPVGGLMLKGTFSSLVDAAGYHYPWLPVSWLLTERYPSLERMPEITCPLLVIHGEADTIVPHEQGARLFEAAPERSTTGIRRRMLSLPEAGHNNLMYVAEQEITAAMQEFLTALNAAE